MRTYKEPKRIDKPRIIDSSIDSQDETQSFSLPCLNNCGIPIQAGSSSQQVDENEVDTNTDLCQSREESEIKIDDCGSAAQKDDSDEIQEEINKEKDDFPDESEELINHKISDSDTGSSPALKKSPPKKVKKNRKKAVKDVQKKVTKKAKKTSDEKSNTAKTGHKKNDEESSEIVDNADDLEKEEIDDEKVDLSEKNKKGGLQKKKKIVKKKDAVVVNDTAKSGKKSPNKSSPKTAAKKKSPKLKQKLDSENSSVDTESPDKSDTSLSPRASKRTPKKNRKYESDEEKMDTSMETDTTITDSSGKKKSLKSPRGGAGKKRKLVFDTESTPETDKSVVESSTPGPSKAKKKKKLTKKEELSNAVDMECENKEKIDTEGGVHEKNVEGSSKKSEKQKVKKKPRTKVQKTVNAEMEGKDVIEDVEKNTDHVEKSETIVKKKKVVRKRKLDTKTDSVLDETAKNENEDAVQSEVDKELGAKPKVKRKRKKKKLADTAENQNMEENNHDIKNDSKSENQGDTSLENLDESDVKKESSTCDKNSKEVKPHDVLICPDCGHKSGSKAAFTKHTKKCVARDKINAESILQPKLEIPDQNHHTPGSNAESDETVCYSENTPPAASEMPLFKCEHCDYGSPKRAMLGRHMRTHGIYVCLRCNFICDTVDGLKDHLSREHKERTDFKLCRNCSRYIKCSLVTLEQHMESCQGPEPYVCEYCEKEFKYESSLKSHRIRHTPEAPKLFQCELCDYKSNYKANLKKHHANIHGDKVKRIQCEFKDCEKMFYSEDNMRRHLKWHSDDRPYKCTKCEKAFKTSAALRGHLITHDPRRPFKCNINECEKDFRSKKLLKNHQEEFHHLSEKRHQCSFEGCTFAFFKKSHLARHVITHTGERKFGCRICGKAFRHSDNLKIHMRQHTDEKPVRCDMCEFTCRQKSSLRYHMKKFHGILPPSKDGNSNSNSLEELDMKSVISDSGNNDMKTELSNDQIVHDIMEDIFQPFIKPKEATFKSSSPVQPTNPMDLYEFRSDDEFGDDIVTLRPEKPSMTPLRASLATDFQTSPIRASLPTDFQNTIKDIKTPAKVDLMKEIDFEDIIKVEANVSQEKPKKKILKKKRKIVKTEKIVNQEEEAKQAEPEKPVVVEKIKKKPGRKPKVPKVETQDATPNVTGKSPKSASVAKSENVTKVPKKRGRKPKPKIPEPVVTKKKLGRPRKKDVKAPVVAPIKKSPPKKKKLVKHKKKSQKAAVEEKTNESVYNDDTEVEKEKENSEAENIDESKQNNEFIMDKLSESPPSLKDDSPYKSSKSDEEEMEGSKKEEQEVDQKEDEIEHVEKELEKNDVEKENVNGENNEIVQQNDDRKANDASTDASSSGIDTDFEEDLKPPPAPRPPPVFDSDEGDIESGPEDMDTPSRDFESTPPKSVAEPSPRVHHLSGTTDTSPRIPSIPGMECKQDMNSSSEYIQHTPKEIVEGEMSDVNPSNFSISENSHMQSTQSPNNEPVPPVEASNNGTEFGSQSESTMPEVDKDYLGQYLQQFDSSTRSEDEAASRIERIDATVVGRSTENINEISSTAHDKDLPPLNLSSSALNLTTTPERSDPLSSKRMEILECDRQQEDHFQARSDSAPRTPERPADAAGYENYSGINSFLPPTRDAALLRQSENLFPPTSTNSSFMRFSESDALLQRQRMATPFIGQSDPNALQNLHRMADSALASHNNPALLRRPTTVPPREDMFTNPAVAAQTIARNPFHSSWAGQEVRPAHWSQTPYLQRSIDRQGTTTSSPLFSKDNYLAGREFMLDASRRSVAERNMFAGLPQSQRPDLAHESFPLERFDFGYFGGHGYPGAPSLDYTRSTCGTSQKSFDERYRQSATGVGDFRSLPQSSSSEMFSGINMNSSFNLDKYMYTRDPVYHSQHMAEGTNPTFLPHGVPSQHTVFDRDYPRGFYQNSPYSFDKQYAAAASAKLGHATASSSTSQERDFPRQNSSTENQMQDPYRHPMLYNMMNRYFE